jgi:ribonuclease HI
MPVLVELLRFIAANEELPRTLKRYAGHDRDTLGKLINAAADRVAAAEEAAAPVGAGGKKKMKVRSKSEVEKASAASAEALQEEMNYSRAEQQERRRQRLQEADEAAEAAREEAAAPAPRTRLFCDGASRGNPGPAGAGAVIISPEGHIVAKVGKFLGDNTNNFAEYMGLILGLKRAKAMGIKDLEILSDSQLLIEQLNGNYAVKAENLKPLNEEARALLKAFPGATLRHVPREENEAADEMSNRAIDERL